MAQEEAPFLLTREQAVERYGIPMRTLTRLYRVNKDFPVVRIGHTVKIHRDKADEWFTRHVQLGIEMRE